MGVEQFEGFNGVVADSEVPARKDDLPFIADQGRSNVPAASRTLPAVGESGVKPGESVVDYVTKELEARGY
jgi:hypothetical protein